MDNDFQFQLPSTFIEVNKNQVHQNQKVGSFICNLYNNYNFELYKNHNKVSKISINKPINPKKKQIKYETQEMKRIKKIKTITRQSNLQQKQVLDSMRKMEVKQMLRQKKRIQKRISRGKDLVSPNQNFEYVDVVNLQKDQKLQNKEKKVLYINVSKMRSTKDNQKEQDCVEVDKDEELHSIAPLERSYNERKIMCENNKALNEKDTYKFNVNWWKNKKNFENNITESKKYGTENNQQSNLDPETMKSLKRQLKPLRRHKLIGSIHAPLAEFMSVNMHQKDGIKDGKMIDSSESQDEAVRFENYDNLLNEMENPPGLIELEKQKPKKRKNKKKEDEGNLNQPAVNFDLKTRQQIFSDEPLVERRLKRALIRMKNTDWQEDRLFTKGMDEDKPIQIDDIY